MLKKINVSYAIAAGLIIVAAICYQAYNSLNSAAVPDPVQYLQPVLDPNQFQGDLRKAYAAAQQKPGLFIQLPIYCENAEKLGRKNLYDCFTDDLATKCDACINEAVIADVLSNRGVPAESIAPILEKRFGHRS
jgi:uncharacterized protein with PCYCGC motif